MRSRSLSFTLPAGVPTRIFNCPIMNLHSFMITIGTNSTYIGDSSVNPGVGLPFNLWDVFGMSSKDFKDVDDVIDIWAVNAVAATVYLISWELD